MQKKIKVMQLIHGFPVGGAEQIARQYCELLNKDKIDVVALCVHNHHSAFDSELELKGIRVIYINDEIDRYFPVPAFMRKLVHNCLRRFIMPYYIRKEKPDVIHSHSNLNEYVLRAKLSPKTKIFHTVHSDAYVDLKKKKDRRAINQLGRRYDVTVVALHDEEIEKLGKLLKNVKIIVLNNGIDLEAFRAVGTKEELRDEYRIEQNLTVIGHVGGLRPVKNHDFLLDVFVEVLKINENAQLWLVGDGVLSKYLKQKAEKLGILDKVIFWGVRRDIPKLMKMMDIMVFPSLDEGLGIAVVEAQAVGIPTLASDGVPIGASFSNLVHFYSLQKSAKEWTLQVFYIMEHHREIKYNGIEKWDIRSIVRKLEDLYFQSLEKGL